ncbi:MAG: small subunit ribosomal protein [Solirubrobacteraceae bacterium]|jgi:small subunit ribosomal protein S9|nr:rpsI [Solirubrobacterales bacterium]MEA2215238.1 small subunit ribosomal protein [Solirubrobacteraceae bacterium]
MADEDTPDDAATPPAEDAETPQHAVPGEDAAEIAGSAEDAALEAAEEAAESGAQAPEPPTVEPAGEGHAVPTADAQELAGSAEDAPLEAAQEAQDAQAEAAAESEEEVDTDAAAAPREKPSVPGAHLEVDIVPEGVDPLNRGEEYQDPYAVEEEPEAQTQSVETDPEEPAAEPISTAAIDLASGARYRATGKRKTAIARVTLRPGTGTYLVNGRTLETHFPRTTLQRNIRQPLETVGYEDRMDVVARLHGGGISAQAGALRHGVSRALLEADPNLRGELKRRGFLTRDSRAKERKKAGLKKARKRPQFSKR